MNVLHLTLKIPVILNIAAFVNNCENQFSCICDWKMTGLYGLGPLQLVGNTFFKNYYYANNSFYTGLL